MEEFMVGQNTWLVGNIRRFMDTPSGHTREFEHIELDLRHVWVRVGDPGIGHDVEVTGLLTPAERQDLEETWLEALMNEQGER